MDPVELIVALAFGAGTPVAWSIATFHSYRSWLKHRDTRSIRELLAVFALFLAAVASGISIFTAITQPDNGADFRRLLTGVAFGAFLAAGVVFAIEQSKDDC